MPDDIARSRHFCGSIRSFLEWNHRGWDGEASRAADHAGELMRGTPAFSRALAFRNWTSMPVPLVQRLSFRSLSRPPFRAEHAPAGRSADIFTKSKIALAATLSGHRPTSR